MNSSYRQATRVLHGTQSHRGKSEPVAMPIYQSSTYLFPDTDAMEDCIVRGIRNQHEYVRFGNPTQDRLNERLALLEGAEEALVFSSGMAAITTAILSAVSPGDEILAPHTLYGQTLNFLRKGLPEEYGIRPRFVSLEDLSDLERHVTPETKLVYLESPTNPNLMVVDLARVADQAKGLGIRTMIDNTFATPINQQPIDLGIDIVVHSATKYLGGHSDLLAGVVAGSEDFLKRCHERMHMYGPTLDPFAAFLLLRSLMTLEVRVMRQNANAMALAEFLKAHSGVSRVHYPGLADDPFHETAKKQMRGFGGMVTMVIDGDFEDAKRMVNHLDLCLNATSLGGVETLVSIPVISSHAWQTPEELALARVTPEMIRFSVGLEAVEDIIADADQALHEAMH